MSWSQQPNLLTLGSGGVIDSIAHNFLLVCAVTGPRGWCGASRVEVSSRAKPDPVNPAPPCDAMKRTATVDAVAFDGGRRVRNGASQSSEDSKQRLIMNIAQSNILHDFDCDMVR